MSDYTEYYLKSAATVHRYETFQISHSAFSKTYWLVKNCVGGVTVTLEDSSSQAFEYYPLAVSPLGASDDLDQVLKIQLGDLGELLTTEKRNLKTADALDEKPVVVYRVYRSDDLANIMFGPLTLEVDNFTYNSEGTQFEAKAPRINDNGTGEIYYLDRFPMLKGFL